jgi:acyl carrier protein phosphodiesterase
MQFYQWMPITVDMAQVLDLAGASLPQDITSKSFLASLHEIFAPTVIEVLINAFLATKLSDAFFATHPREHNTNFLLGTELTASLAFDIPDKFIRFVLWGVFLAHLCSFQFM